LRKCSLRSHEKNYGKRIKVILYEPLINENSFFGLEVINNLEEFINNSEIIIVNGLSNEITQVND